jgi:flagellar biosynthesis protein FlhG
MMMDQISLRKKVWSIAGGKGGTGKSLIAASLGILLSQKNKKVIAVDADLGGANLHTCLNVNPPQLTLSDFIQRKVANLEDILVDTPFENLKLISGASDIYNIANPIYTQKTRLITHLERLPCDHLVIDLGAGTSYNVLDFFLLSNSGILVTLPEPSSVENLYRFLRSVILRILRKTLTKHDFEAICNGYNAVEGNGKTLLKNTQNLLKFLQTYNQKTYILLKERLEAFRPRLIINQAREEEDVELGYSIAMMVNRHLGVKISFIGYLPYDDRVFKSIKLFKPFMAAYPDCFTASCLKTITKKLLNGDAVESVMDKPFWSAS